MDYINFLIEELIVEFNSESLGNYKKTKEKIKGKREATMGLVADPDDESKENKSMRYQYGHFVIQPPKDYKKKSKKQRIELYKRMKETLELLTQSSQVINKKGFGAVWLPRKEDRTLSVVRMIDDPDHKYAAMYQQEDDDKDGEWEHGDFIINNSAKNMNIHTIVHEIGHKVYYELLTDDQAEEWRSYYRARKYKDKNEFVTKYAKENYREDFAETFSVFVLGVDRINELYDKDKINKNEEVVQKILKRFKEVVFPKVKIKKK